MADDNPIFKLSEVEKTLVHAQIAKLFSVGLVELFRGEYALTIVMLAKKCIFGNWTKRYMWGLLSSE